MPSGTRSCGKRGILGRTVIQSTRDPVHTAVRATHSRPIARITSPRRRSTGSSPIESRIIRWRFGLDNEDELTLKEIGDKYNLSRERIRQLQEQAIGKIRKQMRDNW